MLDANRRIEALAQEFIARLSEIAKEELIHVLGGGGVSSPANARSNKATPTGASRRGKKRSSKGLEKLQARVHGFIAKHPGLRIEEINKQLGTTTKDLQLPIRKLIAAKAIKTTGQRRSTKYAAAGRKKK